MSAQTGTPSVAPPAPTVHGLKRLRAQWARLWNDPNPVWMRELRQSARLTRTPIILATVTGMMTLLICSVGGVASVTAEPAKVGAGIFQTFFSLAYAVVTWIGPAVAASTIAGERSSRTWEALLLTGLSAPTIARGKFMAALTYISLYVVMLAPVGALPFLFGGVTATEVILAFVLLVMIAILSVAFGLAVSSKFSSPAAAIIVTLLVALPASFAVYGSLGVGLSFAAHELWPGVIAGPPVWLPTAYVRASFGLPYLAFLVLVPVLLVLIPAWLFYEITIANMASPSDDRSTRLKIWLITCGTLLTGAAIAVGAAAHDYQWFIAGIGVIASYSYFAGFMFAGEPLSPSRRVSVHWDRVGAGRLRRFFGPGIIQSSTLLILVSLAMLGLTTASGALLAATQEQAEALVAFGGYSAAFAVFVVGFAAWARARAHGAAVPRVLLAAAVFFAFVGPWVAMAIAGLIDNRDWSLLIAAPSPTFAGTMMSAIGRGSHDKGVIVLAGASCASAWALIGTGLLGMASYRVRKRLEQETRARRELEDLLAAEDAAAEASKAA